MCLLEKYWVRNESSLRSSPVWPEPKEEGRARLLPVGWRGKFGPLPVAREEGRHWIEIGNSAKTAQQCRNSLSSVGTLAWQLQPPSPEADSRPCWLGIEQSLKGHENLTRTSVGLEAEEKQNLCPVPLCKKARHEASSWQIPGPVHSSASATLGRPFMIITDIAASIFSQEAKPISLGFYSCLLSTRELADCDVLYSTLLFLRGEIKIQRGTKLSFILPS